MSGPRVDGLRTLELGTPGASRARLNALVLAGRKRATAGLLREYEREGEVLEHVGEVLVLLDDAGGEVGRVRATGVDVVAFGAVPDAFALAEGEGDLTGDDFRASHAAYWGRLGEPVDDDTPLVLLRFALEDTAPVRG